jgi:hypothetical protein
MPFGSTMSPFADAVQVRICSVDQPVSRDRRRCRNPLSKLVRLQQIELFPRLDDEGLSIVVADEDVAVAGDRRGVRSGPQYLSIQLSDIPDALTLGWLELFEKKAKEMGGR